MRGRESWDRSEAMKEVWRNPAYRKRIGKKRKIYWASLSPEDRTKRTAKQHNRKWHKTMRSPSYREKVSQRLKSHWADPKYRAKLIKSMTTKQDRSERARRVWKNPAHREKVALSVRGSWRDAPSRRLNMSLRVKEQWRDETFAKKASKAIGRRPTKLEMTFAKLFKEIGAPFKYVGDGKVWIDGKNPDFINCNGQKQIIEVASKQEKTFRGINPEQYVVDRKRHFAKYGFETIVLWSEDNEETILNKLGSLGVLDER